MFAPTQLLGDCMKEAQKVFELVVLLFECFQYCPFYSDNSLIYNNF